MPINVFILTTGTLGDVLPFLAIAKALQSHGHRITFATSSFYEERVAQLGCDFVSMVTVEEHQAVLKDPMLWDPQRGLEVILKHTQAQMKRWLQSRDVKTLPFNQPTLVIAHPLHLPFLDLLQNGGVPLTVVGIYLVPLGFCSAYDLPTMGDIKMPSWIPVAVKKWLWKCADRWLVSKHILPWMNAERVQRGLAPIQSFLEHGRARADLSVALFPPSLGTPQLDWPMPNYQSGSLLEPLNGTPLSERLQQFLDAGSAPLVFTPGTGQLHATRYFETALQAVRQLKRRAIFLTPYQAQVPSDLGEDVLWQDFVPLQDVLPRCAILIHHGGIGTTAEAMRSGVPQLIIPFAFDQFDNAVRLQRLGVGDKLSHRALNAWVLGRVLGRALGAYLLAQKIKNLSSESMRVRCSQMADELGGLDNADKLCQTLESFFESQLKFSR